MILYHQQSAVFQGVDIYICIVKSLKVSKDDYDGDECGVNFQHLPLNNSQAVKKGIYKVKEFIVFIMLYVLSWYGNLMAPK